MDSTEIQHQLQQQPPQGIVMDLNAAASVDSTEIQHQLQLQQQPPQGIIQNPNAAAVISQYLFPVDSTSPHQQQINQNTLESFGSSSSAANQQSTQSGIEQKQQQQPKKKRGRPRIYDLDGNFLVPTLPPPLDQRWQHHQKQQLQPPQGIIMSYNNPLIQNPNAAASMDPASIQNPNAVDSISLHQQQPKKKRGRPRKYELIETTTPPKLSSRERYNLGLAQVFTPHIIQINPGENIAFKIMKFKLQEPRSNIIISASGSVSSVILQENTSPSGVTKHEGQFEIISLEGSFLNSEAVGIVTKTGDLIVTLSGGNGRVVSGTVAEILIAGSKVQVVIASFVEDENEPKQERILCATETAPGRMVSVGGGWGSSRSQGLQHLSDQLPEEKGSNSPLHRENNNNNNHNDGLFGNCSDPLSDPK